MKTVLLFLLALAGGGLTVTAEAQTSPFPASLDSDATLKVAADNCSSALTYPMATTDAVAQVANATCMPVNSIVTFDSEQMGVTGISGNTLTVTRGIGGTTIATHALGAIGYLLVNAYHHNALASAVQATEQTVSGLYQTIAAAVAATPAGGYLTLNGNYSLGGAVTLANPIHLFITPATVIKPTGSNVTLFNVTGNNVSIDCMGGADTFDGQFSQSGYSGVVAVSAASTSSFKVTNCGFQNLFGTAINVTGSTTTNLYIGHNHLSKIGNGTEGAGGNAITFGDFTSATAEDNYFDTITSGDMIYATNTSDAPSTASLVLRGNKGTGIGRMAAEVQMTNGHLISTDNHYDTLLNTAFSECESFGITNGSTPAVPSEFGSTVDDYCTIPGGAGGLIGTNYCEEIYLDGAGIRAHCIGPWAFGLVMGSDNLRLLPGSLFDHNLTAISENGTGLGTGHITENFRATDVLINEPRDQGVGLGLFDDAGDQFKGVHIVRTPCGDWSGDATRTWYGFGFGGNTYGVVRPYDLIESTVTLNAPGSACAGFVAWAVGAAGNPGSRFAGNVFENLGATPLLGGFHDLAAHVFDGAAIEDNRYVNLLTVGDYIGSDTISYRNNVCLQGANSNACGAAGGPAIDGTVTPTLFAQRGTYAIGTTNFCSDCLAYSDGVLAASGPGAQIANLNGTLVGSALPTAVTGCTKPGNTSVCTPAGSQQSGTVAFTTTGSYTTGQTILTMAVDTFDPGASGAPFCVVQWADGGAAAPVGLTPSFNASATALVLLTNGTLASGSYFVSWKC